MFNLFYLKIQSSWWEVTKSSSLSSLSSWARSIFSASQLKMSSHFNFWIKKLVDSEVLVNSTTPTPLRSSLSTISLLLLTVASFWKLNTRHQNRFSGGSSTGNLCEIHWEMRHMSPGARASLGDSFRLSLTKKYSSIHNWHYSSQLFNIRPDRADRKHVRCTSVFIYRQSQSLCLSVCLWVQSLSGVYLSVTQRI